MYHIETNQLISSQINRPVLIPYDFLLKSVSEQVLITAIVINCQIILDLHELNSTNQGYLLKV